jgi:hypothetical protein
MSFRFLLNRRALQSRPILEPFNRHVIPSKSSYRNISLFRRRPLYKPTDVFGRTYLRIRNFTLGIITISTATFSIFYILDARSAVHRYIFAPALRLITPDPEDAHRIAVLALKYGLHPKDTKPDDPRLAMEVYMHCHQALLIIGMGEKAFKSGRGSSRSRQTSGSNKRPVRSGILIR